MHEHERVSTRVYTITFAIKLFPQLSKYAMTAAHEVSAARESINAAEKMQQYFRDFRDFDTFEHRSFMPFIRVEK